MNETDNMKELYDMLREEKEKEIDRIIGQIFNMYVFLVVVIFVFMFLTA